MAVNDNKKKLYLWTIIAEFHLWYTISKLNIVKYSHVYSILTDYIQGRTKDFNNTRSLAETTVCKFSTVLCVYLNKRLAYYVVCIYVLNQIQGCTKNCICKKICTKRQIKRFFWRLLIEIEEIVLKCVMSYSNCLFRHYV